MGVSLDRASILGRPAQLPRESVEVPEFGGTVWVRSLTVGERDQYELSIRRDRDDGNPPRVRARLVVLAVVDEDGSPVFLSGDLDAISALPAGPVDRIFERAAKLSGILERDEEELEEAEKN